jgi:predicted MFS family arabinose efflux permease
MDMAISLANLFSMGVAGWMGDLIGLRETFVISGIMLVLGGLAMGWILRLEQEIPAEELQDPGDELIAVSETLTAD